MGPDGDRTSNHGRYSVTGACRSSRPASCSWRTAMAVNDLLMEPIWKRCSGRTGSRAGRFAWPTVTTPRGSSRLVRPMATPGAWMAGRWSSTNRRTWATGSAVFPIAGLSEEELQLALRGLGRVAPVHQVLRDDQSEVAPDRPRRGERGIGRTDQGSEHRDGSLPLHPGHDHRPRTDDPDELVEERLPPVLRIMLLGRGPVDGSHPHLDEAQPLGLDPSEDLPDQSAPHGVGLHDEQRRLHGHVQDAFPSARRASATV